MADTRTMEQLVDRWSGQRAERLARTALDPADFAELRAAGFHALCQPAEHGGSWVDAATGTRPLADALRSLAGVDPSVALVTAMHPAVLGYWLVPPISSAGWVAQREAVLADAAAGAQWGTITSEPGSGGDVLKTRSTATPVDGAPFLEGAAYAVTGDKHFGSGSGIAGRMITTAIPAGEDLPSVFVLDVQGRPWDGSAGLQLVAEWDGVGMSATQSHAMRLVDAPAVRIAHDGPITEVTIPVAPFINCLFTAVVLGVLDVAVGEAATQVRKKQDELRPYEQVEWTRAETDHWLATQALDGALRAVEAGDPWAALHASLRAKWAVAELAEATLQRLTRVLGGGTFSRRSPYARWFEDVRALGFLRPPWGLAADQLFATSLPPG